MKFDPSLQAPAFVNPAWKTQLFSAKAARNGGIVRRRKRDVHREIGYEAFIWEVRSRGFHMIECGDQYIVICNAGSLRIHC
ncbi:hypothetical protein [Salipiger abyssi]|uniref:hypothetical protein n=1 Tax=Salipiger abyssi TaxID=1250539 RepID=UPI001A90B14E|nr:hypothetical protein [Salipiger abyssi]MBN9888774.1 hypothetical protein [Salipiger abyssi]